MYVSQTQLQYYGVCVCVCKIHFTEIVFDWHKRII